MRQSPSLPTNTVTTFKSIFANSLLWATKAWRTTHGFVKLSESRVLILSSVCCSSCCNLKNIVFKIGQQRQYLMILKCVLTRVTISHDSKICFNKSHSLSFDTLDIIKEFYEYSNLLTEPLNFFRVCVCVCVRIHTCIYVSTPYFVYFAIKCV